MAENSGKAGNTPAWIAAIAAIITCLVGLATFLKNELKVDIVMLGGFFLLFTICIICLKLLLSGDKLGSFLKVFLGRHPVAEALPHGVEEAKSDSAGGHIALSKTPRHDWA